MFLALILTKQQILKSHTMSSWTHYGLYDESDDLATLNIVSCWAVGRTLLPPSWSRWFAIQLWWGRGTVHIRHSLWKLITVWCAYFFEDGDGRTVRVNSQRYVNMFENFLGLNKVVILLMRTHFFNKMVLRATLQGFPWMLWGISFLIMSSRRTGIYPIYLRVISSFGVLFKPPSPRNIQELKERIREEVARILWSCCAMGWVTYAQDWQSVWTEIEAIFVMLFFIAKILFSFNVC
jgi:hypothetical protein